MADHLERDALAGARELDAAVALVPRERQRGELLHHRARGRVGDLQPARERGHRHLAVFRLQLVDLAQVVLDRFAERLRHEASVGSFQRSMLIRLGHSPDPDDAFMFWALAAGAIDTRGFEFEHVLQDIQTLSEWALEGRLETTAMSLASYPLVQDKYAILPHGASMGSGYGPVVVGPRALSRDELLRRRRSSFPAR